MKTAEAPASTEISSVCHVIVVILNQDSLQKYEIVGQVMDILHMETMQSFTMFLLGMLIVLYVLKNLYTVWLTYEQNRFITVNKNKMISQVHDLSHDFIFLKGILIQNHHDNRHHCRNPQNFHDTADKDHNPQQTQEAA